MSLESLELGQVVLGTTPEKQSYWIVTNKDSQPYISPVISPDLPTSPDNISFLPQGTTLPEGMTIKPTDLILNVEQMAASLKRGLESMQGVNLNPNHIATLLEEAKERLSRVS